MIIITLSRGLSLCNTRKESTLLAILLLELNLRSGVFASNPEVVKILLSLLVW